MTGKRPRIVIVGGGFGGLTAAQNLKRHPVDVLLIDRENHHTFQPLLYQVATFVLSTNDIAAPLRHVLRKQKNASVLMAKVTGIDPPASRLKLSSGEDVDFDYLVLAAGAGHSYFGHDDWEKTAPGLKTLEDALDIRHRLLVAFESAENRAMLGEGPAAPLTVAIIGGGTTGVELAGSVAEIARQVVAPDYRLIDTSKTRVLLLEGGPRLTPTFPADLSERAERALTKMGVEVRTGALVTALEPGKVWVGEEEIPAAVVLWAAGVAASPLGKALGAPLDRAGRVMVEPDLSVPGRPNVFVVGDLASAKSGGKSVPGVAPAAIQMGKFAAKMIQSDLAGKPRRPFSYLDKGSLATIGRAQAIAEIGKLHLSGLLAWLAWTFIHLVYLIGFQNRLVVMTRWAWSYVTYERSARLI